MTLSMLPQHIPRSLIPICSTRLHICLDQARIFLSNHLQSAPEVNRLLSRLEEDENGDIDINTIIDAYTFENTESGDSTKTKPRDFVEHFVRLFPKAMKERRKVQGTTITVYKGVKMCPISPEPEIKVTDAQVIRPFITQREVCIIDENEKQITCELKTGNTVNGDEVLKTITFLDNGTFTLHIQKKEVQLCNFNLSNKFEPTQKSIDIVFAAVKLLRLCEAITIKKSIVITRFQSVEKMKIYNGKEVRKVRSTKCETVVKINSVSNTCVKCQRMNVQTAKEFNNAPATESEQTATENKDKSNESNLKDTLLSVMPDATAEMIELIMSQCTNASKHPQGRRWSEKIISVCLQWYCRSPQSYQAFRESKFLLLPSPSTLVLYKNKVKHNVGLDDEVMRWMHTEAVRKQIPSEGWIGGIIIDEMAIQEDIQMTKSGDTIELSGFIDLGGEGDACHTLRTNKKEKKMATHALQLIFLGVTGFRFPFAHFVTDGIQGQELHVIFWQAVSKLHMWGFKTLYTCMDGAQSNRNFMNINIGTNRTTFKTPCTCYSGDIIFTMDFSHVIKKIRNNILKSGITSGCTRLLALPNGNTIQWQMFVDTFKWDKCNSVQLHRKLTNEHLFLSSHSKMRNHLAEEVLNGDMQQTMIQYKTYLGPKGEVLNGAIELLSHTTKLLNIFHDMHPVRNENDPRLESLKEISDWFLNWTKSANAEGGKKGSSNIMSYQCHEDVQACILGFVEISKSVLQHSSTVHITPALINSDVVENIFNQQRSTYNGANTNPNALQYRRSLNSIILGQNSVSTKANAGKSRDAATPFNLSMQQSREPKKNINKKMKYTGNFSRKCL